MSDLVEVEVRVTVDIEDDAVWAAVEAGEELLASVDAHDIVNGLSNNDALILTFIKEMLEKAGSSELANELVAYLTREDGQ